jgi:hypothetical protein
MGTEGKKERKALLWRRCVVSAALGLMMVAQGCSSYMEMSGTVLDAKTGQPVEGARVAIVWSVKTGPDGSAFGGKRVADTDAAGHFVIEDAPKWQNDVYFAIYKQGYICWEPTGVFNGTRGEYRDMGHQWRPGHQTYRLEPWVEGYSHDEHLRFISRAIKGSGFFDDLLHREIDYAIEERKARRLQ